MSVASAKTWIAVSMPQPRRAMRAFAELVIALAAGWLRGERQEKTPNSLRGGAVDRKPLKSLDTKQRNSNEPQKNPKKSKRRPKESNPVQEHPRKSTRQTSGLDGEQRLGPGMSAQRKICPRRRAATTPKDAARTSAGRTARNAD
jgi:hypothetical protein